jgi:hypothetical protein
MLNRTTLSKFIAPSRQGRKGRNISPNLAAFARDILFSDFMSQIQAKISNIFN